METIIGLTIAIGVCWMIWRASTPSAMFAVTVKRGAVEVRGKTPPRLEQEIRGFLEKQFADIDYLKVTVHPPSPQPRSRILIRGNISEGDRQMIRNFLTAQL